MAEIVKKVVGIKIDTKGGFAIEAKEGFASESCIEKTKGLELILGGTEIAGGNTSAYYDDDDAAPISINIEN
jgi:hypothetical protein